MNGIKWCNKKVCKCGLKNSPKIELVKSDVFRGILLSENSGYACRYSFTFPGENEEGKNR